MTFVITEECIDVLDRSCLEDCPADCIYQGDRKMYVNPAECIDCGACEQACPAEAALPERLLIGTSAAWNIDDNAEFFARPLRGRDGALGTPRGATPLGRIGVDTEAVTALLVRSEPLCEDNRPSYGPQKEC
jgi:NAD-dependent dihydropyrimidine dehydrogenase PreA subunit